VSTGDESQDVRDSWLLGSGSGPWRRLHPLSPVVRAGRGLVPLLGFFLVRLLAQKGVDYGRLVADGIVVAVLLILGLISWLVTRWRVENGVLHVETGLLRRRSLRYPLGQVQAIDLVQTGIARLFGLAELRLRMAGGADRGGGRLQSLRLSEAHTVRAELLAVGQSMAAGSVPHAVVHTPAPGVESAEDGPRPERVLFTVPTGRLVGSIALTGFGLLVCVLVLAVLVLGVVAPSAVGPVLSSAAVALVGVGTAFYRRLNGEYKQTVAMTPGGFRLASGLVEKTTETIPVGRVQGIRLVEPLLWRPAGWCRLEVEVAGKRVREENSSQGRQRRALLPVGSPAEAQSLLTELLPAAPTITHRPPGRARWKAPLSYRNLGWGANSECVVTRSGRLRRTTHWVPLEKVQSLRRVEGPVQRVLGLAGLHLDTAGRSIHALIRDESVAAVDDQLGRLPQLCRAARERRRPQEVKGP